MDHVSSKSEIVDPEAVARKMASDYSRGVKDHTTKAVEALCELCWRFEKPNMDMDAFLHDAAEMIQHLFAVESVGIQVRDSVDRLYKYRAVVGLDPEVIKQYSNLKYSREELLKPSNYPCHDISAHTKLFLGEEHPYAPGEEFTYRRPGLIGMKRRDVTDSLEADYLDTFFHGSDGEILGLVEISGTRMRKLPDASTIRWVELIAGLIALAVERRR